MQDFDAYIPTDDEEYMNQRQLNYFRTKLLCWKEELLCASMAAKDGLKQTWIKAPDVFDVAAHSAGLALEVKDLERTQQNLLLIDRALTRIGTGVYGYCDLTGDEIGVRRLQAHPAAVYSVEGQEMVEKQARMAGRAGRPGV